MAYNSISLFFQRLILSLNNMLLESNQAVSFEIEQFVEKTKLYSFYLQKVVFYRLCDVNAEIRMNSFNYFSLLSYYR